MSMGRVGSPLRGKVQDACKFLTLQTSSASRRVSSELNEILKERTQARKRRKIINEILDTEQTYQYHLTLLVDLFLDPMKVACVVPEKVIEGIFCNIKALQAVNASLLEHIEKEGVATAFMKLAPFIKLYSVYANNFDHANKLVEDWTKKSPDFARFKELQESNEKMMGLKLSALLITPIQRVPRYKLLLENLVEKTMPEHDDYGKLKGAFEEISKVALHINECIRQHENFHKMLSIQNSLTGDAAPKILAPGRKFIREGVLSKVCDRGGAKERTFFLFNDILIYAKKETSCTYTCRGVFPIVSCYVEQVMGASANAEGGALFKINCKERTLLLYTKSKQETNSWIQDIKDTISELHANLASLRRGDQPMSPEMETQRAKLRKEKERKRRTAASHKFRLMECASPMLCKDSLYPLREELLPKLTERAIQEENNEHRPQAGTGCFGSGSIKRRPPVDNKRRPTVKQRRKRRHESEETLCKNEVKMATSSEGTDNENFGDDTMTEKNIRLSLHLEDDFVITGTPNTGFDEDEVFARHESSKNMLNGTQEKPQTTAEPGAATTENGHLKESPDRKRLRRTFSAETPAGPSLGCDKKSNRIRKLNRKAKTTKRYMKHHARESQQSSSSLDYVGEQDMNKANVEILSIKSNTEEDLLHFRSVSEDGEDMTEGNCNYVPKITHFSLTDGEMNERQADPDTNCQIM